VKLEPDGLERSGRAKQLSEKMDIKRPHEQGAIEDEEEIHWNATKQLYESINVKASTDAKTQTSKPPELKQTSSTSSTSAEAELVPISNKIIRESQSPVGHSPNMVLARQHEERDEGAKEVRWKVTQPIVASLIKSSTNAKIATETIKPPPSKQTNSTSATSAAAEHPCLSKTSILELQSKGALPRKVGFEKGKRERATEEEKEALWNATNQFAASIIKLSAAAKVCETGNALEYIVWCSENFLGTHPKYFDSRWKTSNEANDRARYLFYWKNPWHKHPEEMSSHNGPESIEGLVAYECTPEDTYDCWRVGVVPANAYLLLPEASRRRHSHDENVQDDQGYYGW
jgi:hypothetical protein